MKEDKKKAGAKLKVKESKKSKKKKQAAEEFLPEEELTEVWDPEDEESEYVGADGGYDEESEYCDADGYDGADGDYAAQEYDEAGDGKFADESEAWEPAEEEYCETDGYDTDAEYAAVAENVETSLSEDLTGEETLAVSDEDDYMDELIRSKKLENQPSLTPKRDRDERALIREQERLAQEKKRKKRSKRRNIIIGVTAAVLVVGIWFIGWGCSLIFGTSADTSTVEIVVEVGQEVVYAKLTSVKGNEITYTVAEAVETTEDAESTAEDGEMPSEAMDGETPSETGDGEMPEGFDSESMPEGFDSESMPEGFDSESMPEGFDSESMPEGFDSESMPEGFDSENMPDDFDGAAPSGESGEADTETDIQTGAGLSSTGSVKADTLAAVTTGVVSSQTTSLTADITDSYTATSLGMGGDMGGGMQGGGMQGGGSFDMGSFDMDSFDFSIFGDNSSMTVTSSATDTFTYDDVTYQLTEETNTMLIPVGTDVTTRLGTVTTFSRLAAGDCVALVLQEVDGEDVIMAVYIIG